MAAPDAGARQEQIRKLAGVIEDTASQLAVDSLLDSLVAIVEECAAPGVKSQKPVQTFLKRYTLPTETAKELRIKIEDFERVRLIGRGAYGEVWLVKYKATGEVFALKKLSKCEMLKRSDTAFFWEERDIMSHAHSPWIVTLHYAFQDPQFLYMAMEYMAGGNLVTLQDNYDFPEEWVQFYTAELIMAVHALHQMGYVHRDIKPDNLLLDAKGHIKLADFGTCIKMDSRGLVKSEAAVGTPDYISPEVLESQDGRGEYGKECDWWSVGVFLYELLFGDTPFYSETMVGTYGAILNHNPDTMTFSEEFEVSDIAKDLVKKLLCRRDKRLGSGERGVEEIKEHPFFAGIDWEGLRERMPPFVPEIDSEADASNFPDVEKADTKPTLFSQDHRFSGNQLPFVGFTYTREKLFSVLAEADAGGRVAGGVAPEAVAPAAAMPTASSSVDLVVAASSASSEQLAETQGLLEKAQADIRELQQALDDAKEESRKQQQDAASLAAKELKVAKLEATEAQRKLEKLTSEVESMEGKVNEAKEERDKAVAELSRLQRDTARAEQNRAGAESEVDNLSQQLQAARAESTKLRLVNEELEAAVADALANQDAAVLKLDEMRKLFRTAEAEIDELQDKVNSQARSVRRGKERLAEVEDECEQLRTKSSQLRSQLLAAQHQVADLEEEIAEIAEAKNKSDALVAQLKQSVVSAAVPTTSAADGEAGEEASDLQTKLSAESELRSAAEAELASATGQLEALRAEMKKMQKKRRESMDVGQTVADVDSLRKRIKELEEKLRETSSELEDTQQSLEAAKKRGEELRAENESQQEEIAGLKRSVESNQAKQTSELKLELESAKQASEQRIEALTEQLKQLTEKQAAATKELDDMQAAQADAASKLSDKDAMLAELQEKLKHEQNEAHEVRSQFEHLQIDADLFKEQLASMTHAHEKQQSAMADMKAKFEEERVALLAKLEVATQAQSGDSAAYIKENEILRRELQRSQNQVLEKQGAYAQQCLKTQEAVAKLQAQMLKTGSGGTEKKTTKKSELEATVRRLTKANKGWELKAKKLEDLLSQQEEEHRQELLQVQEDEETRVRKLQENLKKESDALRQEVETLRKEFEEKAAEAESLQLTLDTLQTDEAMSAAARATLKKRVSSVSEILESWVMVPNRGNIRKYGWARRYLILGPSGLFVFENDSSKAPENAEVTIPLADLFQVRPVQQHECIHAKPGEIPKIFQVMAIKAPRPSITQSDSNTSLVSRDRVNTVANDTLQSPRRSTLRKRGPLQNVPQMPTVRSASFGDAAHAPASLSGKNDVINIHGHEFEKVTLKKTACCVLCQKTISTWGIGKQKCFECKHCHCVMHVKHMESTDCENIEGCKGGTDATVYFFLAHTAEEQRRWVSRISFLIQRRGAKTLEQAERKQRSMSQIFEDSVVVGHTTSKSSLSSVMTAGQPVVQELDQDLSKENSQA